MQVENTDIFDDGRKLLCQGRFLNQEGEFFSIDAALIQRLEPRGQCDRFVPDAANELFLILSFLCRFSGVYQRAVLRAAST
jgi:hypothetical protein